MSEELNGEVLEAVMVAGAQIDDYGQRSAIGMARSWIDNQKPVEREKNSLDKYVARDDLAEKLVEILEVSGVEREEMIEALGNARAVVNAPFLDPGMSGQQSKGAILKLGKKDA